jgi:hypothetical protein
VTRQTHYAARSFRFLQHAAARRANDEREVCARELLVKAGFSPDELREFAGLLEFAAVLAGAGHEMRPLG